MIQLFSSLVVCAVALFIAPSGFAAEAIPAGSLQAKQFGYRFVMIYPGKPPADALQQLRARAARSWPALAIVTTLPDKAAGMTLHATMEKAFVSPSAVSLKHFGRGLSPAQVTLLAEPRQAMVLTFVQPRQHTLEALRSANTLAAQLALEARGLLWDDDTREMFTPERWQQQRLAKWTSGVPEVSTHITIHSYRNGEMVRAITLGMNKFGLPDLVVEQFPSSSGRTIGALINLLGQALAEGGAVKAGGQFDLNLKAIMHPQVRDSELKSLKPNAQGMAKLMLVKGTHDEGDPDNRLIEIRASNYPGPDDSARQSAMLAALFGFEDSLVKVRHDAELLAASAAAKTRLPTLQAAFQRGLAPGEYLQVKAPFKTSSGGNEWMWVEVSGWKGKDISGVLQNEPGDVPGLKMGQIVKVRQQDVFDYIRSFPDGREEGNTTGAILKKMQ